MTRTVTKRGMRPPRLVAQKGFREALSQLPFEVPEPSEDVIAARWAEHPQALLLYLAPEFRFAVRVFRLCHDVPLVPDPSLSLKEEQYRLVGAGAWEPLLANLLVLGEAVLPNPRAKSWQAFALGAVYGQWVPPDKVEWSIDYAPATKTWAGGQISFTADTSEEELLAAWRDIQKTVKKAEFTTYTKLGGRDNRDILRTSRFVRGCERGLTYGEIANGELDEQGMTDDAVRKQLVRLNEHVRKPFVPPLSWDAHLAEGWREAQSLLPRKPRG